MAIAVDRWLDGGSAAAAERNPAPFRAISADANLNNWVVEPDGRLHVLNVPIARLSTPARGRGSQPASAGQRAPQEAGVRDHPSDHVVILTGQATAEAVSSGDIIIIDSFDTERINSNNYNYRRAEEIHQVHADSGGDGFRQGLLEPAAHA